MKASTLPASEVGSSTSESSGLSATLLWGLAGIAATVVVGLITLWWGGGTGDTEVDGDCNAVGDSAVVECNSASSPERRAWERLPLFAGLPAEWRQVEDSEGVLDAVFGEATVIDGGADDFVQESEYRRNGLDRFSTLAVDIQTATVGPPSWTGPRSAPFYAAVTVSIDAGPLDSSACGIAFDWRLELSLIHI